MIAKQWVAESALWSDLMKEHGSIPFGVRAIGYFCLDQAKLSRERIETARALADMEQYDLANRLFAELVNEDKLGPRELLSYGSCLSEERPSLEGGREALELMNQALQQLLPLSKERDLSPTDTESLARCYHRLGGQLLWLWGLSSDEQDLGKGIEMLYSSIQYWEILLKRSKQLRVGRLAQAHLKVMLALRIRDDNRQRPDAEHHADAMLALKPERSHGPRDRSYLLWYQAITLADAGDADGSRRLALQTFSDDARIMGEAKYYEIGRRQYTQLRRFIEQQSHVLRNPSLVGQISQVLQAGHPST